MNKAKELWEKVKPEFENYHISRAREELEQMSERGRRDVRDKENWGYYQWLAALVKTLQPKQITELGAAMGVSTLMMLSEMPEDGTLYSITLHEADSSHQHGLEFSFIKRHYPQLIKVVGNDLNLSVWPEGTVLDDSDIWFIDTLHEEKQLKNELITYEPFFKKSTIILLDDIKLNDMYKVWLSLPYDKYDASILHVPSGFGIFIYESFHGKFRDLWK